MTAADGAFGLRAAPTAPLIASDLPRDETASLHRHLWVISQQGEPCALEHCAFAARHEGLVRDWIKHTNLTGCAPAHCGGELWFLEPGTILINGNSGRYGPRNMKQLRDAGLLLKTFGYRVAIMGYDDDLNRFAATVVSEEDLEWL